MLGNPTFGGGSDGNFGEVELGTGGVGKGWTIKKKSGVSDLRIISVDGIGALPFEQVPDTKVRICAPLMKLTAANTCQLRVRANTNQAGEWGLDPLLPREIVVVVQVNNGTAKHTVRIPLKIKVKGIVGNEVNISRLSVGQSDSCAIVNGKLYCWGWNFHGQLGNVDAKLPSYNPSSSVPVQVCRQGQAATEVSMAMQPYACGVFDGGVRCWGNIPGVGGRSVPLEVIGLSSGVTTISTGASAACAIANGALRCWGLNFGTNGLQTTSNVSTIKGFESGVTAVSVGYYRICAIVNGALKCFTGKSNFTGNQPDWPVPSSLSQGVTSISLGYKLAFAYENVCATTATGVHCFEMSESSQPDIIIPGLAGASATSLGIGKACAIVNGGVQ